MKLVQSSHQESEIPTEYKHEENGEFWCYITGFEFRESKTQDLKSPEFIANEGVKLSLFGYMVKQKDFKASRFKSDYYVRINGLEQWAFDHEEETKGVWVQSKKNWYKLLQPSEEFRVIYDSFEKKSNIWLDLRPVLVKWMKTFDKCSDEEEVRNRLSLEYVLNYMQTKGHTTEEIYENAFYIYDKAAQDLETFSFDDQALEPENQLLNTPFIKDLLNQSSEHAKMKQDEKDSKKIRKESAVIDDVESEYSSDSSSEYNVVIKADSSSSSEEDDEYVDVVRLNEDDESEDFIDCEEDEEEDDESDEDYGPSTGNKKRKAAHTNKQEGPLKKKRGRKKKEEKDESKAEPKKRTRRPSEVPRKQSKTFWMEYELEPGVPSAKELLDQEFSPRLLVKLSTKYDPRVAISPCSQCKQRRIMCLKERPICSHCLENGMECTYAPKLRRPPCVQCSLHASKVCNRELPCEHCKEGECFYANTDNGLLIGEMRIKALKELYEQIDSNPEIPEIPPEVETDKPAETETLNEKDDHEMDKNNERLEKINNLTSEIKKWKKQAKLEGEKTQELVKKLKKFSDSLD